MLQKIKHRLFSSPADKRQRTRQQRIAHWQNKWERRFKEVERHRAHLWQPERIPGPVRKAVADEWFHTQGRLLDIGCGHGEIAGWLSQQGYPVVGIDFIPAAVEKARQLHARLEGQITFEVADICDDLTGIGPFDNAIDVGCFHGIPHALRDSYVDNLLGYLNEGGRFLLMRSRRNQSMLSQTEKLFAPHFEIVRVDEVVSMDRQGGSPKQPNPGAALWMVRR